jgi:hypothetical protein
LAWGLGIGKGIGNFVLYDSSLHQTTVTNTVSSLWMFVLELFDILVDGYLYISKLHDLNLNFGGLTWLRFDRILWG